MPGKKIEPAYLHKDETRGELTVWTVDGQYIRENLDEEFTNFGQRYRFPFIPENELWIDQGARKNEREIFIDHLLIERELMAQGMSYDDALQVADAHEKEKRQRAGLVRKLKGRGNILVDPAKVHEKLWKKLSNGVSVWIVNGTLVRSGLDTDFASGGNDQAYGFVPPREVWIDNMILPEERKFVALHELHERRLMEEQGLKYDQAHARSSRLEHHCRDHPEELDDALAKEGWR